MKTTGLWMVTRHNVAGSDGQVALYTRTYFRKESEARAYAMDHGTEEVAFRPGRVVRGCFYPAQTSGVWGMA